MSWTARNGILTDAEMKGNAQMVADFFLGVSWTRNSIAAILGNMQAESGVNPGAWEGYVPYNGGYGLTQWTPYTKLSTWATDRGWTWLNDGDTQCLRIDYEANNGLQWFANAELGITPPITFGEFTQSHLPIATLSNYFLWFYEHPADPGPGTQAARQANALFWDSFLDWHGAVTLPPWLLFKFKRRLG